MGRVSPVSPVEGERKLKLGEVVRTVKENYLGGWLIFRNLLAWASPFGALRPPPSVIVGALRAPFGVIAPLRGTFSINI